MTATNPRRSVPVGRAELAHQHRPTTPTPLERPFAVRALPPTVARAFAAYKRRGDLLRSEVFRRHGAALTEHCYAMEYQPTPGSTAEAAAAERVGDERPIRALSWNIQRGLHVDAIKRYLDSREDLRDLDVLMLNEVDIGMARSGNRNVAREIAEHLGFGYVFGNSYLCLGFGDARDGDADSAAAANAESMHGNAILSRFPFVRAENISVEVTRDKLHSSEPRLGHKKALWAELDTPKGRLPVASVHLDAYASLQQRAGQMRDVLDVLRVRGLDERVLLGGDMNTTTYDIASIPRLIFNLASKMARGGFPHAMHHYMHPQELYERPTFAVLEQRGFDYAPFNDLSVGTARYEVGSAEDESKVSELLPGFAVTLLRHKLKPWDGVAQLKIDWFAGRGVEPHAPATLTRPTVDGLQLSDHDPIRVDVTF